MTDRINLPDGHYLAVALQTQWSTAMRVADLADLAAAFDSLTDAQRVELSQRTSDSAGKTILAVAARAERAESEVVVADRARDGWKAKAQQLDDELCVAVEALRQRAAIARAEAANLDRTAMRPVVEAAKAWRRGYGCGSTDALIRAVDALSAPAESAKDSGAKPRVTTPEPAAEGESAGTSKPWRDADGTPFGVGDTVEPCSSSANAPRGIVTATIDLSGEACPRIGDIYIIPGWYRLVPPAEPVKPSADWRRAQVAIAERDEARGVAHAAIARAEAAERKATAMAEELSAALESRAEALREAYADGRRSVYVEDTRDEVAR